jgi:hypothetical protein
MDKNHMEVPVTWEKIKLQIGPDVKKNLEERHILEDEVKQVIYHAEAEGDKLYQANSNKMLAKLRIGSATFYVEYTAEQDQYIVRSAYAHKSEITG